MKEIYEVTAGARPTQLVRKYDVGDEVLSIANPDLLPDAPNVVTVYDPTGSFVTVKYTGKVNNSLTGCTYCEGVLSHTFEAVNSFAVRTIAQYDFDAISEHVSVVEENYIDGAVIDGEELPITDKKVVIPVSSDGVLGVVKPGANITIDDDEKRDDIMYMHRAYSILHTACPYFGFIVRYPDDKRYVTGYVYEPWHIRYVGRKAAMYISKHKFALEEYFF